MGIRRTAGVIRANLVSTPEVGHSVAVDIVRVVGITAGLPDEFYHLLGGLAGHSLPQTSHQSADDGCRERGAHVVHDGPTTIDQSCRRSHRDDIGFYALVLRRSYATEGCNLMRRFVHKCTNGHDVIGIGRNTDFFECTHP